MQQNARIFWLVIKVYFFDQYETWKYWIEVEHMSQSGKKDTKSTLLDFLAERAGCAYLSDLRKPYLFPGLSEIMDSIEPVSYTHLLRLFRRALPRFISLVSAALRPSHYVWAVRLAAKLQFSFSQKKRSRSVIYPQW